MTANDVLTTSGWPSPTPSHHAARPATRRTIWLPWLLAALAVAAQPLLLPRMQQAGCDDLASTAVPAPAAAPAGEPRCTLTLYHLMANHPSLEWVYSDVMREAYSRCRCALDLRTKADFLAAQPEALAHSVLLVDSWSEPNMRHQLSQAQQCGAAASMGAFHLTDEQRMQSTAWYSSFAFVYRHYYRPGLDSLAHLLPSSSSSSHGPSSPPPGTSTADSANASGASAHASGASVPSGSPFWFPVGYNSLFTPSAGFQAKSLASRSKLWFFSGDLLGKPDRQVFVDALKEHPQAERVEKLGWLHTYQGFGGYVRWDALDPWQYSAALYVTVFAPCPTGSGESLRMWEALEAGAIPVLPRHEQFDHLEAMGLDIPQLPSWSNFSDFILQQQDKLEEWEQRRWKLLRRYAEITAALRAHVADQVCALAP